MLQLKPYKKSFKAVTGNLGCLISPSGLRVLELKIVQKSGPHDRMLKNIRWSRWGAE
jgi:hypothetical protein